MRSASPVGLAALALTIVGVVAGCAAPADATASSSDDFTEGKSSISREINPTKVPTDTPIGRTMDGLVSELGRGLREPEPKTLSNGVVFLTFVNSAGDEVFHRQTSPDGSDVVRVGCVGGTGCKEIFADHPDRKNGKPRDGKVDHYEKTASLSLEDNNYDGKVDVEIVPADPDTSLEPFGDWTLDEKATLANRIVWDRDFNGWFEEESLTARGGFFVR